MSLPSFAHETIIIIHPTYVDDHGSRVATYVADGAEDWEAHTETVEGCILEPLPSQDADGDRKAVLHNWHLMAPPGTALAADDQVKYRGIRHGVHGKPQDWPSPTGLTDYLEAHLREWIHGA